MYAGHISAKLNKSAIQKVTNLWHIKYILKFSRNINISDH